MRLNRALVAVVGIALVAGLVWMLRAGEALTPVPPTGEPVTDTAGPAPAEDEVLDGPTDADAVRMRTPPPPSTPVPELWAQLGPAARAGDAPSACRLAIETLRCDRHLQTRAFSQRLPPALPADELAALEAFVADPTGILTAISAPANADTAATDRAQRLNEDIDRHCGTVATERRGEAFALLRQAALAGVPDAQATYVEAFTGMLQPGAMADPVFERWMDEAPTVMTRMLDAGHPDAPSLFAEAYGRDSFHGQLFPYDLMRSVAYGQLDQRIGNNRSLAARFVDIRRQALTPAQRDEADRLTAQLYAAHYAGRPLARNERRRDLLYTIHAGVGAGAAARADECQANSGRTDER
jgi:hypothetical protein